MKNSSIIASVASIAALTVAFVFLQVSFELSVSILFAAGLVGIALADYARVIQPHAPHGSVLPLEAQRIERYRLAA